MALVAELVTELKTKDVSFSSGLKLATIGVAAFVAAQVGLFAVVNKSAEVIDEMAKSASRMGTSLQAFQELSYAAKLSGVSMDSVQTAFKFMEKNVDAVAQGNLPKVSDALKRIGLDGKELAALAPEKAFLAISEGIKSLDSHAGQIGVLQTIFGRGGAANFNLMVSDIKAVESEFDKLGLTITQQQADQSVAFVESRKKLTTIFEGFSMQVAAQVTPAFTAILDGISDTILKTGNLREVAAEVATYIVDDVKLMISAFQSFVDLINKAINGFHALQNAGDFVANGANRLTQMAQLRAQVSKENPGISITDIDAQVNRRMRALDPANQMVSSTLAQSGSLDKTKSILDKAVDSIVIPGIQSFIEPVHKAAKAIEGLADSAEKAVSQIGKKITDSQATRASAEIDRILGSQLKEKAVYQNSSIDNQLQSIFKDILNGESDKTITAELAASRKSLANSYHAGEDITPLMAVFDDLKKFQKEQSAVDKSSLQMEIKVSATPGLYAEIVKSKGFKGVITDQLYTAAATAAAGESL